MFAPKVQDRMVPGAGNPNAKICLIGDISGNEDLRMLRPFSGVSGTILDSCLHAAGLTRQDCYITNIVKGRLPGNDTESVFNSRTGSFTLIGNEWLDALREELSTVRANVLVPLGALALAGVTGRRQISKLRGYVTESLQSFGKRKVIGTLSPASTLRGQYIHRYYITADFRKAKAEAAFPEIRRPKRNIVTISNIYEALSWMEILMPAHEYACDIEVENFEVSAISFAITPETSVSFPMGKSYWTEDEEVQMWYWINKLLNTGADKYFQNGIFDVAFLATQCGIHVAQPIHDTMIAHHIMYPEMLKGLGFLGSLYCGSQEYWKDMVKFTNIKEES